MKKSEQKIKNEWIQYVVMDSDGNVVDNGFDTYEEALRQAKDLAKEAMKKSDGDDGGDNDDVDIQIGIFKLDKVVRMRRSVTTEIN